MSLVRNTLGAAITLSFAASAYAADIRYDPNWVSAFNFKKDEQPTIGIVKDLQVGTTVMAADVKLTNPTTAALTSAVGAVESYAWTGGSADPMALNFYVSKANALRLRTLLQSKPADTTVKVSVVVFQYDASKKTYFEALAPSQAPLTGKIATSGSALQLEVAPTATSDLPSPEVYAVTLRVATPSASAAQQSVKHATGQGMTVVKKWGPGPSAPPARQNPLQQGNTE